MFRGMKRMGVLLLAVYLCCSTQPVMADAENTAMLAGGAALMEGYYSRNDESETEISETSETSENNNEESGAQESPAANQDTTAETAATTSATVSVSTEPETSAEDEMEKRMAAAKQAALDTYDKLGIVEIGSGHLNVRAKASEDAKVIGKMLNHNACEILKTKGDWYYISSGYVEGYVSRDYILTGQDARDAALEAMELKVQIDTETLNVRTEPSEDAQVWTQVDDSDRYPVLKNLGEWVEIELDNDSTGYVSTDYVRLRYTLDKAIEVKEEEKEEEKTPSLRQQIVDYAMQFLGNPYVWGGESLTKGVDCSGFTMQVYKHFGISLPHYSVSQASKGRRVDSSSMKPGDLVFYAKNGTINHVTMYIGNGQVIGAQSRRSGITIKSWNYRTPVKIVNVLD